MNARDVMPMVVAATTLLPVALAPAAARTAGMQTASMDDSARTFAKARTALVAAAALLPRQPPLIAVMDVTRARPGVREYLLTLDAFTVKDNSAIYIVQQSELLRRAVADGALYHAMLATVIWHEMAHQSGADEPEARQAEEGLWTRLMRDGVVDLTCGLRYLSALRKRPDDSLMLRREDVSRLARPIHPGPALPSVASAIDLGDDISGRSQVPFRTPEGMRRILPAT